MAITATETETAVVSFGGAFVGFLITAAGALNSLAVEHAALAGGVAALAVLGYNTAAGNVVAAAPKA